MTESRLGLGQRGEELAACYLTKQGYNILCRNYRSPFGEIDIIARKGPDLIFVEIKTRRTLAFGLPQEAVGPRKQRQIIHTAQHYLQQHNPKNLQPRFDVISILVCVDPPRIEHFTNAFTL